MARLRFRQFEQELAPVEQKFGVPSYPASPPPEQMVGNEVLRKGAATERFGKSLLDFGSTIGKVITNEQGRIRKEVWDQGMPLAFAELDEKLEQKIRDDYQYLSPSQVETQWAAYQELLFGDGKDKIGTIENSEAVKGIENEADRKRLIAELRARMSGVEMRVLRQQHGLQSQLQASGFSNQVRDGLNGKLEEIQHHEFDHASYSKDDFTELLNEFSEDLINNAFTANDIPEGQKQRLKLGIASDVNNWRHSALRQNYIIRQGIGKATWEKEGLEILQTNAATDTGFRRNINDPEEDSRLTAIREHGERGVALGFQTDSERVARFENNKFILDSNDLEYDLENDPELAMARLSRPDFFTPEKMVEYYAEYGIKIDESGKPTDGKKSNIFYQVEREWNRLKADGGKGYYPSIIKNRQAFYERAVGIVTEKTKEDVGHIKKKLRTLADILVNPESDPGSVIAAQSPDRTSKFANTRGLKGWELEQKELVLKYGDLVREQITDPITQKSNLHLKSRKELAEILEIIHPDRLPEYETKDGKYVLKDGERVKAFGSDKENLSRNEMSNYYQKTKLRIDALREAREEDQAGAAVVKIISDNEKALGDEVDLFSDEAIGIVVKDILDYNGVDGFPTSKELPGLIQSGTVSIWTKTAGKHFEDTWNEFKTGEQKRDFLLRTLGNYSPEFHPAVLQELYKLDGFSEVDQLFMEIKDAGVLNHLHNSQVNRKELRENSTLYFGKDDATVENIRKDIVSSDLYQSFLSTFYAQPEVHADLIEASVYYTIQLGLSGEGSKNYKTVSGGTDAKKASAYTHLFGSRYVVIEGGEGKIAKLRIPIGEFEGVTADDMQTAFEQFTPTLLEAREDDPAWNFVRGEKEAWFGETLYQWITNSDESGAILVFYNEQGGRYEVAKYNGKPATLTWDQLRKLEALNITIGDRAGHVFEKMLQDWEESELIGQDRRLFAAEEMEIANTPAVRQPAKRIAIDLRRKKRAEEKELIKQETKVEEELEEIIVEEEVEEERKPEWTRKDPRYQGYQRMFWMVDGKRKQLNQKQIETLMNMSLPKAAHHFATVIRGKE